MTGCISKFISVETLHHLGCLECRAPFRRRWRVLSRLVNSARTNVVHEDRRKGRENVHNSKYLIKRAAWAD